MYVCAFIWERARERHVFVDNAHFLGEKHVCHFLPIV